MYNVFIIVDNPRDREEAVGSPDWNGLGLQVAGVFSNGLEALHEAGRTVPDIALIDVFLPAMDAFGLGRRLRERNPYVQLVFVAGGGSASGRQPEARSDVRSAAVVPIGKPALQSALKRAAAEAARAQARKRERDSQLRRIKEALPLHRERFLRGLLLGSSRDGGKETTDSRLALLELRPPAHFGYRVLLLQSEGGQAEEADIPDAFRLMGDLERLLASESERQELFLGLVPLSDTRLAIVAGMEKASLFDAAGRAGAGGAHALERVLHAVEQAEESLSVPVSIGISREGAFVQLTELHGSAARLLDDHPCCDKLPRIVFEDEIGEERDSAPDPSSPARLLAEIREIVYGGSKPEARLLFDRYWGNKRIPPGDREYRDAMVQLSAALQRLYVEAGISVNGFLLFFLSLWNKLETDTGRERFVESIESLLVLARNQLLEEQRPLCDQVVKDMKRIIMKRYAEPIAIRDITDAVHLSFAHANSMFKHKTGRKLFDYMTEYRLEAAKALLRDGGSETEAVARQSGFSCVSHFRLSFRKATGLTPSEYSSEIRDRSS